MKAHFLPHSAVSVSTNNYKIFTNLLSELNLSMVVRGKSMVAWRPEEGSGSVRDLGPSGVCAINCLRPHNGTRVRQRQQLWPHLYSGCSIFNTSVVKSMKLPGTTGRIGKRGVGRRQTEAEKKTEAKCFKKNLRPSAFPSVAHTHCCHSSTRFLLKGCFSSSSLNENQLCHWSNCWRASWVQKATQGRSWSVCSHLQTQRTNQRWGCPLQLLCSVKIIHLLFQSLAM